MVVVIFALEKAKDLYDEVLDDDASAPKCEAANKLTYITKSLMDLAIVMENIEDEEFTSHIKMIVQEAVEENGFNDFR